MGLEISKEAGSLDGGYRWKERKIKRMRVNIETMGKLMITSAAYRVVSGVPVDARCLGAHVDPLSGDLWLKFESEEFDPVPMGEIIPELPADSVVIHEIPEDMMWAALRAESELDKNPEDEEYDTGREISEIVDLPCVSTKGE